LLHVTGIAEIGPPDSRLVGGTLACAHLHDLRHELLAAPELMRRFPAFRVPPDYVAVVQPDGGVLEVEPAIAAQLALATAARAKWSERLSRAPAACASLPIAGASRPGLPSSRPARG